MKRVESLLFSPPRSRFDDKILLLYARGITVREIQAYIQEIYQTEVSHNLISAITDEVMGEVETWQSRPLDRLYAILYLDVIVVKDSPML